MGALGDIIVDALEELLEVLFSPIEKLIEQHAGDLVKTVVGTPHPNAVFSRPTNKAWPGLYDFHWDTIVPLALLLWALAIGLVILLETTSHLFSGYHRSRLKRRAFTGLLGIFAWWWIAAFSLRLMEGLNGILVPNLTRVGLFDTISMGAMGVLGLVISLFVNFTLFVLIAVIYFLRHIMLYLFVLLMPILIALWIPGVGPFAMVSQFSKRIAGFYVPFLFMTVPVAVLFRLGEILGSTADLSMGGLGAWLTGLVIPLIAVVSPFVLFWQAGAIFFMAERASHQVSKRRAKARVATGQRAGHQAKQGSRNFVRGARGQPAIRDDGQTVFGSGTSRAHAAGSRLAAGGAALRNRFGGGGGSSQAGGASQQSQPRLGAGEAEPELDAGAAMPRLDPPPNELAAGERRPRLDPPPERDRSTNFETLRGRTSDGSTNT